VGKSGEEPSSTVPHQPIPPDALALIQSLYEAGLCLQAYNAALEPGPLKHWRGPQANAPPQPQPPGSQAPPKPRSSESLATTENGRDGGCWLEGAG
jgi:hypothetical protein